MVIGVLAVFFLLTLLLLFKDGLLHSGKTLAICAFLSAGAFVLRYFCLSHITLDYTDFLKVWVEYFRANGGFSAMAHAVGNYNVPYLYFLAAFSYLDFNDLYLIKLLSILFDVILAYYSMRLVSVFTKSAAKRIGVFYIVLLLPTVVLNSACWGQCDSIFVSFAVMSVCFALEDKPMRSVAAIAMAFAFKLQAVFILPLFFLFLLAKKIRLPHLLVFPVTYLAAILPAVLLGRPFWDTLTIYFSEASTVGSGLNYNSSSIYAFLKSYPSSDGGRLALYGVAAAFVVVLLIFILSAVRRKSLSDKALLCAAAFFVVAVPYFLPHMHDRYFYMADILVLVFAFVYGYQFVAPALVCFASLLGYAAYLLERFVLPMRYGATALAIVIVTILAQLVWELFDKHPRRRSSQS